MVIFLCVLALFFLFLLDVPSSSVSMLAGGPITSLLTRVFLTRVFSCAFLIDITSGSFAFSFPLASSWITLIALSPVSSGNGGIAAVACGGRRKIWGWSTGGGCGCVGSWGLSLGGVTCLLGPLPCSFPKYLLGWGQKYIPCPSLPQFQQVCSCLLSGDRRGGCASCVLLSMWG